MVEYEFRCTECGQRVTVDARMRRSLLEEGCPLCGAPATVERFQAL